MTDQALPSEKAGKKQGNFLSSRTPGIVLGLIGICFLCTVSLYFAEVHPRYITLPIPLPKDQYELDDWLSTTYSVQVSAERVFLLSRKTYVSNGDASHPSSWNSLVAYFDKKLDQLGWVRSEIWAPCDLYLPEGEFLQEGANGYVHYFRKGYENYVTLGSNYKGDTICLAVWPESWKDDGSPAGFLIDLLSARRSYFSRFMDIFSG